MRSISIFLLTMLISIAAIAGNGKITGKVTDEKGMPVTSATLSIKGTGTGAVTDIDGLFTLVTAPGTYTVEVRYTGYKTKEIDEVNVTDDGVTTLNVSIERTKNTNLQEVTVRSSFKRENINALYALQKNSATIQDGISADVIKKSPDRSTGEVLKRVSGTTIQDNKFVIVRGLSDRYNTALVDNAVLPSTEPNRKAFSFDIIPANLIDNITITKAATPDLPGDFSGGVINIITKEIPDKNFNAVTVGVNYNTVSTGKTFQSGYRSSTDFLGFDDGARKLPKGLPSATQMAGTTYTPQQSIPYLSKLNNDYGIREHTAMPGISLQGVMGRVYQGKGTGKLGFTAGITYNHNETIKPDLVRRYDNYDYVDQAYVYSSTLGALFNVGYSKGKSKYTLKTLYNRLFDDQFLYREGINIGNSTDIRYYAYDLSQKSLFKTSLEGDHQLGKGKFNWLAAYNNVTNSQPDQRKVAYFSPVGSGKPYSADNTTVGRSNNRLFGKLNENIINANLNYTVPVKLFEKSTFKAGFSGQYRTRDVNNRYLGAVMDQNALGSPEFENVRELPVEQLYSQELINKGLYQIADQSTQGDKYDATATTAAGYAMMDNTITDKIRVVWGVRFESYNLNLKAATTKIDRNWNDVLPSLNFTYSLNEKSNLRASYFRSVARPELRELAGDLTFYDYELNAVMKGNYDLKRTQIDNADLRYEIYPGVGEIFSVSVFYKNFKSPIENSLYGVNSSYEITPKNSPKATNYGVELEVRKNLGFIASSSILKQLNFYANVALIKSTVKVEGVDRFVLNNTIDERQLAGQSPYVINTSLGYTTPDNKLSLNVLYNRIGQRIYLVSGQRFGPVYEMPRNLLDFQASYNLNKKSELRLNVKDIFSNPVRFYFDQDVNGKYEEQAEVKGSINPEKDMILSSYRPGTTFTLSYIFKF